MASRRGEPGAGTAPGSNVERGDPVTTVGRNNRRGGSVASDHRRTEVPPPRDPELYALTDHFRERLSQEGRYASIPTVSSAIVEGQLRWNQSDGWRFATVTEGVRTVVAVGDTDTGSPVIVTAWTEVVDEQTAITSRYWTATDVETIRLRTALSQSPETSVPGEIRPRVVQDSFEMGHHHVLTEAGVGYLSCVDCGGRFRSKSALHHRLCRD